MFYVYAIYNSGNEKIYIGQTDNIQRRIKEHNQKVGNHFTAKLNGNWDLIYKEEVNSKKEAIVREKQLKSFKGRESLKQYIPR